MNTGLRYRMALALVLSIVTSIYIMGQTYVKKPKSVAFTKIKLLDKYISEGASVGDINKDGHMDIVAGNLYWKGPSFKNVAAYGPVGYSPITGPGLEGYADNFFTFPLRIDENDWMDILQIGIPGTDSKWVRDPGKIPFSLSDSIPDVVHIGAIRHVCHESPQMVNIIGDENKELLAFSQGKLVLGVPIAQGNREWELLSISEKDENRFPVFSHGLGAGDINGDGLTDVLEKTGWWQQPVNWDRTTPWEYHPVAFSHGTGGAQMFAYDIDGDGDTDVITAMDSHGYGLSWFEQIKIGQEIGFKEHKIMTHDPMDNTYGVSFSQLHAMSKADIDGDGIPDIVTGKCYYAHNGRDPGAEEPAALYWFRTRRNKNGTTELVPYKIDDDSGVGRQITTADLNKDGKIDLVTANKKGVFAFIQK
ncbi:VCBS repeat-containing protein [Cytophaga sp. FL35]|uniref:FG-GAP repeat domain-containing protein n=1 Tax=Cytophaga sp. FL35 TaxID=1904456 RepID=UPI0016539F7B|nr:VCBS repeat-containing protein [Cytophaga sp. FL35]MBC6999831.1 VCBS repeat-containing protein [Cytophaga sp. FL35]